MLVKIAACVVRHFCAKQRRTRHARSSRQCDCMSLHTARTLAESKRMSTLNQLLLHVHATDACLPACPGRRLNPSANYARSTTESFKRALERAERWSRKRHLDDTSVALAAQTTQLEPRELHSLVRRHATGQRSPALGRFVYLHCSLGWDDSYTSCGRVGAAWRS